MERTWQERLQFSQQHPTLYQDAIDAAMDECERHEKEAAEKAEATERSPVAALAEHWCNQDWIHGMGQHLKDATAQQAALWRQKANQEENHCAMAMPMSTLAEASVACGRARALRRCADELEGK